MKITAYFVLLTVGLESGIATPPADTRPLDEAVRKELKSLAGRWKQVSLEYRGEKTGPDHYKHLTIIQTPDGKWELWSQGELESKGTFVIDVSKKPKVMETVTTYNRDFPDVVGTKLRGIYSLEGDTLKWCVGSGRQLPKEFSAGPETLNRLVIYSRERPKNKSCKRKGTS